MKTERTLRLGPLRSPYTAFFAAVTRLSTVASAFATLLRPFDFAQGYGGQGRAPPEFMLTGARAGSIIRESSAGNGDFAHRWVSG
jgi:hypothetical protein